MAPSPDMSDPNAMDVDASTSSIVQQVSTSIEISEPSGSGHPGNGEVIRIDSVAVTMEVDEPSSTPQPANGTPVAPLASITSSHVPPNGQATPPTDSSAITNGTNAYTTYYTVTGEDGKAPQRMVRTGYVYDPLMMLHCQDGYMPTPDNVVDSGEGHPEEPMRIKRIFTNLKDHGLIRRMKQIEGKEVTYDQVRLVHSEDQWLKVQGTESGFQHCAGANCQP